jgi:hypothetical protein
VTRRSPRWGTRAEQIEQIDTKTRIATSAKPRMKEISRTNAQTNQHRNPRELRANFSRAALEK